MTWLRRPARSATGPALENLGGAVTLSRHDVDGQPDPLVRRVGALADTTLGVVSVLGDVGTRAARRTGAVASPLVTLVERTSGLPRHRRAPAVVGVLVARGTRLRRQLTAETVSVLDRLLPAMVAEVLRRLDLTEIVLGHVDLDRVVAEVDLDAVVARVDVGLVVDRVDVAHVVERVDLDLVASRLDVNAVAGRLDLDGVLDRLDLTDLALRRLDLDVLVPAILAHVDLEAIALEVIDSIDLPDIIRDSSGALTSDTVRGARLRTATADQALGRIRDRLLSRETGGTASTGSTDVTAGVRPAVPGPPDHP